jgi:hypothetical protein
MAHIRRRARAIIEHELFPLTVYTLIVLLILAFSVWPSDLVY